MRDEYSTKQKSYLRCSDGGSEKRYRHCRAVQRFQGSASLTPFADAFPGQFVELGIAEQNLVSVSAGLAKCGKNRLRLLRPVFIHQKL